MWQTDKLGNVCVKITDGSHYSPAEQEDGYPMLSVKDMRENGFDYSAAKLISKQDYDKIAKGDSKPLLNDVLIAKDGSYLKQVFVCKKEIDQVILSSIAILRPNQEKVNSDFLAYVLSSPYIKEATANYVSGSALPRIILDDFKKVVIPLPPLPVQHQIAAVLGRYDALLENYQAQVMALEGLAQELYREWFVRGRCPGAEAGPNGELPVGWATMKFTDAISVLSGGTPTTSEPNYWDGDVYWFSPGDSGNSCYVLKTEKTITELGLKNCNSKLYPIDTVIITARGTVGKCVLLGRPMAINQSNYALVGKTVSQYFTYFKTLELAEGLQQEANGAVFSTITTNNFERADIVVPDAAALAAFDEKVTPLFQAIRNYLLQSETLRATRDALLPRLLSGQLLPTVTSTLT